MTQRHLKRCLTALIIREMKVKTTMRYQLTSIRTAVIKILETASVGQYVEQKEPS